MKAAYIGGVIAGLLIVAACMPLALIWSFNTLFSLSIAYSLKNWFAAFVMTVALTTRMNVKKS